MSRKKTPSPGGGLPASAAQQIASVIRGAQLLMERKEWEEARRSLEMLNRRHPQRAEVLAALVELYERSHNEESLLDVSEQLAALRPNDPAIAAQQIRACMVATQPMKALQASRQFLERWPDHRHADAVRRQLTALEEALPGILQDLRLPEENGFALALLHEEARTHLTRGRYPQARAAEEKLLEQFSQYAPAWNNIAQCDFFEGKIEAAIAVERHVLGFDPENIHALGNLIRFLWLTGQPEEAYDWAARLRSLERGSAEIWHKKAETFGFLGDDAAVLEAFGDGERSGRLTTSLMDARLFHMAAVASLRLGQEAEARRLWAEALRRAPGLESARRQRDDLRQPISQRQAPWVFTLPQWLLPATYRDVADTLGELGRQPDFEPKKPIARACLERHPELVFLIPHLLDRGEPIAREVALRIAIAAATPEMLAALRGFGLDRWGPDALRFEALRALVIEGVLPVEPIQIWSEGEWREMLAIGFSLHPDPAAASHPGQVARWVEEAGAAAARGDAGEAERLLRRALEIEPDAADLLGELAGAIDAQERAAEAAALRHQTYERFPDSVLAQVGQALVHLRSGEVEAAGALLDSLCRRRVLHIDEFAALADAEIERRVALGEEKVAQEWFTSWSRDLPNDRRLERWRAELGGPADPGSSA